MLTPEVVQKLVALRAELATAHPDPTVIAALQNQLDAAIAEPTHAPHVAGLSEKLRAAAVAFEVTHPQLVGSLEAVIISLGNAGI
jgi:hypothetical protein